MSSHQVSFGGTGLPQTVLPPADSELLAQISDAAAGSTARDSLAVVAAKAPRSLDAWAALGDAGRDTLERYAYYRIGYHRGLDTLRQNGWRGSGYVRWEHESNRAFLRCLSGLARCAAEIGEDDEAERCELFLRQLDPTWPPAN